MGNIRALERIAYLAKEFNIVETKECDKIVESLKQDDKDDGNEELYLGAAVSKDKDEVLVTLPENEVVAVYKISYRHDIKWGSVMKISNVRIHENIFTEMVKHDPTDNKVYVQWMLITLSRFIRDGVFDEALRFATEDLRNANEYLKLFHSHKKTKMFKKLCKENYSVHKIEDPRNINQYKNLSQVFDAVDPYIERDASELESKMIRYVKLGEAEIPVKDRNWTLYIPKTQDASTVFDGLVSWCTARVGDSNFKSYRSQKTSLKKKSDLYIVINNNFFRDKNDPEFQNDIWQFHFESGQTMNRQNQHEGDIRTKIIEKSDGLKNYFYDLLVKLGRADTDDINDNQYIKHLLNFGFTDAIFEIINTEIPTIKFQDMSIPKLPSLSKFKNIRTLFLHNCKLEKIPDHVCELETLTILALSNNCLTELPENIGNLKNLVNINLTSNTIKRIPDSITNLDKRNGGKLTLLTLVDNHIDKNEYDRLKILLPSADIRVKKEDVMNEL